MLSAYEWILQDSTYFYQVSLEDQDRFFDDYIKRAGFFGKSPKMYLLLLMERYRFMGHAGRGALIKSVLQMFYINAMTGMNLYEMHECIKFELYAGNIEIANKFADIVFREGIKEPQGEIPGKTYGYFAEYHIQRGEYDLALEYVEKALPFMVDENLLFFDEYFIFAIEVFRLKAPARARKLWEDHKSAYDNCKNTAINFFFAAASYRLLKSSDNPEDVEKSKKFYETALEIGKKFDKRHDNKFFCNYLDNGFSEEGFV